MVIEVFGSLFCSFMSVSPDLSITSLQYLIAEGILK